MRGLIGTTWIFAVAACPAPKDRPGTIEAPSLTATRLLIVSTLSNSITGFGGGPARASQSIIVRRSAAFSWPRINGQRDRKAAVTFFGTSFWLAGRMAKSSSSNSPIVWNAGSSMGSAHRPRSRSFVLSIFSVVAVRDRKSTRLNSSHTVIYTLSLHDALPIFVKQPDCLERRIFDGKRAQTEVEVVRPEHFQCGRRQRSEEHTSELQSHSDLHSFPTRRSSDLRQTARLFGTQDLRWEARTDRGRGRSS